MRSKCQGAPPSLRPPPHRLSGAALSAPRAHVVLVIGRGASEVRTRWETRRLATSSRRSASHGHAVLQARDACARARSSSCRVISPHVEEMIHGLVEHHGKTGAAATLLTASCDATGMGGLREGGRPVGIVEHRDATPRSGTSRIGTSVYCSTQSCGPPSARSRPERKRILPDDVIGISPERPTVER